MFTFPIEEKLDIDRLLDPNVFPHDVDQLELIETHISWVILTGHFAYKIKKPVQFDFVDYSTVERRKDLCLEEFKLNCRFAPVIYFGVVPVFEVDGQLKVGEDPLNGDTVDCEFDLERRRPIEYAVKMRQFDQDAIVAARMKNPELTANAVERFGCELAETHESLDRAPPTATEADIKWIEKNAIENLNSLRDAFASDARIKVIDQLDQWTKNEISTLQPFFAKRLSEGNVRKCHGDLHLKNIVQLYGRLIAFDGIEFNETLQWNDVVSEIAFVLMDFVARGRSDLGWRFLNSYLEFSGDYEGLSLLRFYVVYRALVRAKVTWLNPKNHTDKERQRYTTGDLESDKLAGPWDKYFATASSFAFDIWPALTITHGFSGSGKSTAAINIIEKEGGVRIRSDSERHRLAKRLKQSNKYTPEMNAYVYSYLLGLARICIQAQIPVIVDATFLKHGHRIAFEDLAKELDVRYQILNCAANLNELCGRISKREQDPSEATIDIVKSQLKHHDPLTDHERELIRAGPDRSWI